MYKTFIIEDKTDKITPKTPAVFDLPLRIFLEREVEPSFIPIREKAILKARKIGCRNAIGLIIRQDDIKDIIPIVKEFLDADL